MVVTWRWEGWFWAERITFLSTCYIPGPALGAPETAMNKIVRLQGCLLFNCAIYSFFNIAYHILLQLLDFLKLKTPNMGKSLFFSLTA